MDIRNNNISDQYVDKIASIFYANKTLIELRLENNNLLKDCDGHIIKPMSTL